MKRLLFVMLFVLAASLTWAQSTANYTFSSSTTGSLVDISSGATTLLTGNNDDAASTVNNIGFTFMFMGTAYTQFSINSNGQLRLGSTAISGSNISSYSAGVPILAPMSGDNEVNNGATFKVTGTAPNRVLVIEWNQFYVYYTNIAGAGNMQALLYEGTGKIEYIYGDIYNSSLSSVTRSIFISSSNTATTGGSVTVAAVPTYAAAATPTVNTFAATVLIANLGSTAQGSRTVYTFTPPAAPAAPSGLNFTGIAGYGMTLNWTDNATNETNYVIYNSTDGINYSLVATLPAGSVNYSAGGLALNTIYYWIVAAINEGSAGPVNGTQATTAVAGIICGDKTVGGSGTPDYPTLTAAFTDINTQGLACNINLILQSGYVSTGETFPLNTPSSIPMGTYSVTIYPSVTGLSITSANAAGIIIFNGTKNVTFDGRVNATGSTKDLIIENTNLGTSPTVQFINESNNNTLKYCRINSRNNSTSSGTLVFGTTTGVNGNDNNTIDYCDIYDGTSTPFVGVYSVGTITTTLTYNSNNTISNCNIYNYFNAAGIDEGIYLGSGNTDWTLSGNNFYQTATRTYTLGASHYGMYVSNLGNNFTITNNNIGGSAPSCGGTAWTVAGAVANRFVGLYMSVGTTTVSSVQNNLITNFVWPSSSGATTLPGVWGGIYLLAGSANIGTVTGNTIGSGTGTGAIQATVSTTGGVSMGIGSASTGTFVIANNTIGSITLLGSAATISHAFNGIWTTGAATSNTINNNLIGSTTTSNSINSSTASTSSTVAYVNGIYNSGGATAIAITNNTIANLNSAYLPAAASSSTIMRGIFSSAGTNTITGNTVRNLSTVANATGVTSASAMIGLYASVSSGATNISRNTIYNIANGHATAAISMIGLYCSLPTSVTNTIERNSIYNIGSLTSGAGVISGIYAAAGGTSNYQNNMVTLGNSLSTSTLISGILDFGGTNNYYFNSVYIGGNAVIGTAASYAFNSVVTTNTRNFKNNIFFNGRSNGAGTGKHYAVRMAGTGVNPTGLSSDNNLYFANGTGAVFGYYNADVASFAAWKIATGQDMSSINNNPQFIDPSNAAAPDLHINAVTPTTIESGGVLIAAILDDFDGQTRATLSPTDIGADAGNFVVLDLTAPAITYTLLLNTNSITTVALANVSITDIVSGVNTTIGTRPRVYYKKATNLNVLPATNDNTTDGWKWTEASNGATPFNFTIDFSLINGGVVAGDNIQYFVTAEDLATTPNVGINSGTFAATPASVSLTGAAFPISGTINNFNIVSNICGTFLVGASQIAPNYTNLTAAFADMNNRFITCPVVLELQSDYSSAGETYPLTLNINGGSSAINTITVKPGAGVTASITGALASAPLIKILNSNTIIDGSNNGSTTRDLTITNTSATAPNVIVLGSSATLPITNVSIKNTVLINGVNTSSAVIISDGATPGNAGYFNNITIQNNSIQKAFMGLYCNAVVVAGNGNGLNINTNDLNASGANAIRYIGLYLQGIDGATVNANNLGNITTSVSEVNRAIWIASGTINTAITNNIINGISNTSAAASGSTGIFASSGVAAANLSIVNNTISAINTNTTISNVTSGIWVSGATGGVVIDKNKIFNVKNTSTSGYSAIGIIAGSSLTAANINITNNVIYDIAAYGWNSTTTDNGYGINLLSGGGYNVYYNSISLSTNQTSATGLPACMIINSSIVTAASLNIRNNIFSIDATIGTNRYAVICNAANTVFASIDYNDYYTSGTNLGYMGSNMATIANWRTATGQDVNSMAANPLFTSATDLTPQICSPVLKKGIDIPTFTTSYNGIVRSNPPDMGAYQLLYTPTTISAITPVNVSCNGGSNGSITITAIGGTAPLEYSIDGGTTWQSSNVFSGLILGNYNVRVRDAAPCTVTYASNPVIITQPAVINISNVTAVNPLCNAGTNGSITITAAGGTGALQYSIDNGATYQAGNAFNTLIAGSYTVKVKDANNCEMVYASNPVIISEPLAINIASVISTNVSCNGGNNATITVNASDGTGALQYSIDNGTTYVGGNVFNTLIAGSYIIKVKDANNCEVAYASNPVVITEPSALSITNVAATNVSCNGGTDGSITVTATGGFGALQYSNDNGGTWQGTNSFTGLLPNSYTIRVKDANNCELAYASNPVVITQPSLIVISNVSKTDVTSCALSDGTITITAAGGTGSLQYSIDNGTTWQASNIFNALPATNYDVRVKDANDCIITYASNPVSIVTPAAVVIDNVASTDLTCFNSANGTITITASAGTAPYTYSINGGTTYVSNGGLFTGLGAASYNVTVRDNIGCISTYISNPVVLIQPDLLTVGITHSDVSCFGGNDGSATANVSGGTLSYGYSWSPSGGTGQTASGLTANTYTVTVDDGNACTASASVIVLQATSLDITGVTPTNISCFGGNNGQIVIAATGGTGTISYSIDNGSNWQSGNGTFTGLTQGSYTILIEDANNCQTAYVSNPLLLTQPSAAVDITNVASTANLCYGGNAGTITVTASGGVAPLMYSINNGGSWQLSNSFSGLVAGNYTVVVKDDNNCQLAYTSNPVIITEPGVINISSVVATAPSCNGSADASITIVATGGTGLLQYSINNGTTYQTSNIFNGLIAGSYTITVEDANLCEVAYTSNPLIITDPAAVAISNVASVNVLCFGNNTGSITVTANGGSTPLLYSINNGTTFQTSNVFGSLIAGSYNLIVKDSNDCSLNYASNPIVITGPAAALAISNLVATNVGCSGGNNGGIVITATGGTTTYQYSVNNGTTWQTSGTYSTLIAGSYTVLVKDANNCQVAYASNPVIITQPAAAIGISSVTHTNVLCLGNSDATITITGTGGTPSYQYSIDNGSNYQVSNIFTGLGTGSYTIRIKDANNCTVAYASNPVVITEPATAVSIASAVGTDLNCNGGLSGIITVTASGGTGVLQYSADNGTTWTSSNVITGLAAGTHNIWVRDANLCTAAYSGNPVTLLEPNPIIITGFSSTNVLCHGSTDGSIEVYAIGGTGALQYSIDSGATWQSAFAFNGLAAGNYDVMAQDANNCIVAFGTNPVVITEPASISITNVVTVKNLCNGGTDASIEITATGGTGALEYTINNGLSWTSTGLFTGLTAGSYTIRVRDENYCVYNYSANPLVLVDPPAIVINNVDSTDITTYGGSDGTIQIVAYGGTGPLQYSVDNGASWQFGNTFGGLIAGGYFLWVQDENGCMAQYWSNPVILTQPSGIDENGNMPGVMIYPDPSQGEITIEAFNMTDLQKIEITTIEGKVLDIITGETFVANNMKMKYEFAADVKGMYFVRLTTGDKVYVKKIVVN